MSESSDTPQSASGAISPSYYSGSRPPSKKRRTLGSFPCQHCDKVFTRSDHLARHNLNHEPKEVFRCDVILEDSIGRKRLCGKTFVRKDLKERHAKRHLEMMGESGKRTLPLQMQSTSAISTSSPTRTDTPSRSQSSSKRKSNEESSTSPESPSQPNGHFLQISNLINENVKAGASASTDANVNVNTENVQVEPRSRQNSNRMSHHNQHLQGQNQNSPVLINTKRNSIEQLNASLPAGQLDSFNGYQNNQLLNDESMSQQNLSELYSQTVLNFSSNIPQTQNDILSWLFNDSPTNVMSNSPHESVTKRLGSKDNLISLAQQNQIQHQQRVPSSFEFPVNGSAAVIPSPHGGSQFSPLGEQIQGMASSAGALNMIPPMGKQMNTSPQSNFNGNIQAMNNYGFQDSNIFSNDDNPLDELFIRQVQLGANPNNGNRLVDGSAGLISTPALLNLNMTSTASSNSPTNTNDSDPTPKNSVDFSPVKYHAEKQNLPKHKHIFIDSLVVDSILKALKSVTREDLSSIYDIDTNRYTLEDRISYYLSMYWLVFHPQFTILHKPSFDTKSTEPLLLASMIIVGCHYSSPTLSEALAKAHKKSVEFKFSMMIASPLRYMIFQHEDFKTPVRLWVLQSLNMLEWVEKNFLSRGMHERAHVHHGTTVQLLRRSPLLGGNPANANKKSSSSASGSNTSAGEEDSDAAASELAASKSGSADYDLFVRWVESESMKRVTFLTFYLDIIDYIKFRHNPQINFYQLQLLNLPCDDEHLWESNEVNGSFRRIVKRQKKLQQQADAKSSGKKPKEPTKIRNGDSFLNVLKKLLRPYKPKESIFKSSVSIFTRKILLAGLVSIMYQMQQTDVQNSSPLLTTNGIIQNNTQKTKIWKEILTKAFDYWHFEIIESYSSQILSPSTSSIFNDISSSQVPFPMYHLSQIIGMSDINHYDIAIFGGSPRNMSVNATMKDHYVVQRKLTNMWLKNSQPSKRTINELINLRNVIHCYLLLWQLMLRPIDEDRIDITQTQYLDWNVNRDYFDTMYAVSIATLVLWCYAFSTCGLESQRFSTGQVANQQAIRAIGGYQYLGRVRQEFMTNLHSTFSPHEILTKYCDLLSLISNKQNISGLCFLVGTKLLCSQWEVIRENAKLILNCGYRSIGKKNILCPDLFQNEFDD
ncbi:C2H2 zinc finger protein [Scheffersomyces stipitis CBS 6054]|uniref:C2H2 zinc finger protein n=1 Tax=Scheffersomyces stipitis (strain ATCC 58785 / CBS 6054 / NBRC 10063 / NRRL Y-11545) TaxID=322104 RepID=A3LQ05_PICST|nr:C2H2 zinc finger protein [Scheffersomyces stipitis CBS 6054]ABN64591.2 C2H2 zinc finger protein [Scheffersomyces stipitis CBS 6054]